MTAGERQLWSRDGFCEDAYVQAGNQESGEGRRIILPLAQWLLQCEQGDQDMPGRNGVLVAAAEAIEPLLPFLKIVPLIALDFPVFSDGRSYSKAVQLKTLHHYTGELRAVGDVLIDQVSHMLRCGFDTLEVMHPLTRARLAAYAGEIFPGFYQPGAGQERTGTRRVWRPVPARI